jgi:hypothetical protein
MDQGADQSSPQVRRRAPDATLLSMIVPPTTVLPDHDPSERARHEPVGLNIAAARGHGQLAIGLLFGLGLLLGLAVAPVLDY